MQLRFQHTCERALPGGAESAHRKPPRALGQSNLGGDTRGARPQPPQACDRRASLASEQYPGTGASRAGTGVALRARMDIGGNTGRRLLLARSVGKPGTDHVFSSRRRNGSRNSRNGVCPRFYNPVVFTDTVGSDASQISSNRSRIGWHSFGSLVTRTPRACVLTGLRTRWSPSASTKQSCTLAASPCVWKIRSAEV